MRICVEHFAAQVQGEIGGKAKAMIVTRSRLHAVRYRLAVEKYLAERSYSFKALVAFSGTVQDDGQSYTEANMNGFPEAQTARTFEQSPYRFLIVANKFLISVEGSADGASRKKFTAAICFASASSQHFHRFRMPPYLDHDQRNARAGTPEVRILASCQWRG